MRRVAHKKNRKYTPTFEYVYPSLLSCTLVSLCYVLQTSVLVLKSCPEPHAYNTSIVDFYVPNYIPYGVIHNTALIKGEYVRTARIEESGTNIAKQGLLCCWSALPFLWDPEKGNLRVDNLLPLHKRMAHKWDTN